MGDVTRILRQVEQGDRKAADELLTILYAELRQLAASKLARERPGQTLQPTALVHEAYLRLVGDEKARWENRGHFFAAAAKAMWRILVDIARRKAQPKHGGGSQRRDLLEVDLVTLPKSVDLLALDEAIEELATQNQVKADLVKLRFFTGMTVEEAGEALGISRTTASRYWRFSRAWLLSKLGPEEARG